MAKDQNESIRWEFDLTDFKIDHWKRFKAAARIKFEAEAGKSFHWRAANGALLMTSNNPETGVYYDPNLRAPEIGYASYMTLRGPRCAVMELRKLIKKHAAYIKEDFGEAEI